MTEETETNEFRKEKRFFKRYKGKLCFNLNIDGKPFHAETLDYSAEGISISVHDNLPIDRNEFLDIHTGLIDTISKVMWVNHKDSVTKIGLQTPSVRKGSLSDYWLSDILIGLQRTRRTGVLEVTSNGMCKKVYINDGGMIFSTSNQNEDRLGDMLFAEGKINRRQYDEAVELIPKTGQRQGRVLVDLGYITPHELILAVRRQIESIIISLFRFQDGHFEFREGPLSSEEVITIRLPVADLIYRGVKTIDDEAYIRSMCPAEDAILYFSPYPLDIFQGIKLDEEDKKIFFLIDGKKTLKELTLKSHLGDYETLKTVFALLATRMVDVKERGETHPDISPEMIIGEYCMNAPKEIIDQIESMYDKYKTLSSYDILGISRFATEPEIRRAYYRAAKEFHPDRYCQLPPEMREKLNTVFSYVSNAYKTIENSERRMEYDRSFSNKTVSAKEGAWQKFNLGRNMFWNGDYQRAESLLSEATTLDSDKAKYHYYHGETLLKLGDYKEADKAIRKALSIESTNPDFIATEGYIFIGLGFLLRARHSFERALGIEPLHKKAKEGLEKLSKIH